MATQKGIDISKWQESVNFAKVKAAGIQFAILREGYRKAIDGRFLEYVKGCNANGIPIHGVYHFLYSLSKADAVAEAKSCIANIQKAGLDKKSIIVFADFEYDTVKNASKNGVKLGKTQCIEHTKAFCEYVESQGYKAGIYSNIDYYRNMYEKSLIDKYVFWLADYTGGPDYDCTYQQYTSSGKVSGINGNVDMNYYYGEKKTDSKKEEKTVGVTAQDIINVMAGWVGKSRSAGTHHDIIDLYNSYTPRARGYAVTYSDAYCDTTVSAAFIKLKAVSLIGGTECGVENHVQIFKSAGIWEENGSVTPQPGWIIVYNWDDATQPNDGYADHIGIVEKVSGGYITCIEGNMNGGVVGRRTIPVGWGYIRGYAKPKYAASSNASGTEQTATQTQTSTGTTLSKAKKWNGIIIDKTGANVRTWAGTENHQVSFSPLKYGTVIEVCDTIKAADQTDWYYIRYNGRYGFVSAALIQRKETAAAAPFTPKEQATKKTATYGASIGPDKSVAGTYKVTADSLNIRNRAGVDTAKGCTILGAIPEGTKVQNYGFYSMVGGVKWLYIQVTYDGVTYTGHCSGEYLKKV